MLEEGDITKVDVLQTTINDMKEVFGTSISGYNPLEYIGDDE